MSNFEHFEQQERSFAYLTEFGKALALEAAEVMQDTEEPLAGLIVEHGAAEYEQLRAALEQAGQFHGQPVLSGIVARSHLVQMLEAGGNQNATQWIDQEAPSFVRRLPILVLAKNGLRMGAEPIPELNP